MSLSIKATEPAVGSYAFDGVPASVRSGTVRIAFTNAGKEQHEFGLVRLEAGHTLDDVRTVIAGDAPEPAWAHPTGGAAPRFQASKPRRP